MRSPVIHVAPALWSGAGSVITRLAESQSRRQPVIVTTTARPGRDRDWPEYRRRLGLAGIDHFRIDLLSRERDVFLASVGRLRELIDRVRPAVVHAHAGVPTLAAALARAASRNTPRLIAQMYSWNPKRPEWMNVEDALGFGAADQVVCSARAYERLLRQYGVPGAKLVYVPWGLPLDTLHVRVGGEPTRDRRTPVIGFVGRIEPRKHQLDLVRVTGALARRFPGVRLELVGPVADADYASRIRQLIRDRRLEGVTITGQVRDPTVRASTWDLFVSLSSDEGQGLAVLEAMALGVPVAARPVAGISDFLSDGKTGIALPLPSIAEMSRTLGDALEHPARLAAIAQNARRLVERRYDWARTLDAFDRLYGV